MYYLSAYIAVISLHCQSDDLQVGVVLLYHIAKRFLVKTIKNCWISATVGLQAEPLFTVQVDFSPNQHVITIHLFDNPTEGKTSVHTA